MRWLWGRNGVSLDNLLLPSSTQWLLHRHFTNRYVRNIYKTPSEVFIPRFFHPSKCKNVISRLQRLQFINHRRRRSVQRYTKHSLVDDCWVLSKIYGLLISGAFKGGGARGPWPPPLPSNRGGGEKKPILSPLIICFWIFSKKISKGGTLWKFFQKT